MSLFVTFAIFTLQSFLKLLECGIECFEGGLLRVFLQHVVQQTHTYDQLFGVLISQLALGYDSFCHGLKIMMATEIEVQYFFDFIVLHLCHIEMVRMFLFITIAIHNIMFLIGSFVSYNIAQEGLFGV